MENSDFIETALHAARAVAEIQLPRFGQCIQVDRRCGRDIKLRLDRKSDDIVIEVIRARFPEHMIFSEETGFHNAPGDYLWIIDPLDGSVNYFQGLHYFCCSIACFRDPASINPMAWTALEDMGAPVAAVISAPALGQSFTAIASEGARLNGNTLQPEELTSMDRAMVGTSFGSSEEIMCDMFERVQGIARDAMKVRCLGSTALGIAQVASGQLNAYVQRHIHAWDIAAACMIASEAGRFVKAERDGADKWKVVACNPGLIPYFMEAL